MFSVHCSCTHPLLHSSVRRNNEDNTCSFHVFIHCRWTTMNILVIHLLEMAKKERQRKHLYDRIGTPTVSSNLGTPLPPSLALCVSVCVYEYVCVWTGPPLSALLAPCSVLPPREGASRLFEVSLQLQGLTPQVSPWLFTQSWCNSAGKTRLCHEYKARFHSNGVNFTSTLVLFWPASDRVSMWQKSSCKK